jgi:hypothetical protein
VVVVYEVEVRLAVFSLVTVFVTVIFWTGCDVVVVYFVTVVVCPPNK